MHVRRDPDAPACRTWAQRRGAGDAARRRRRASAALCSHDQSRCWSIAAGCGVRYLA